MGVFVCACLCVRVCVFACGRWSKSRKTQALNHLYYSVPLSHVFLFFLQIPSLCVSFCLSPTLCPFSPPILPVRLFVCFSVTVSVFLCHSFLLSPCLLSVFLSFTPSVCLSSIHWDVQQRHRVKSSPTQCLFVQYHKPFLSFFL